MRERLLLAKGALPLFEIRLKTVDSAHFLPKSLFQFLCVNPCRVIDPCNLIVTCMYCTVSLGDPTFQILNILIQSFRIRGEADRRMAEARRRVRFRGNRDKVGSARLITSGIRLIDWNPGYTGRLAIVPPAPVNTRGKHTPLKKDLCVPESRGEKILEFRDRILRVMVGVSAAAHLPIRSRADKNPVRLENTSRFANHRRTVRHMFHGLQTDIKID